MDNFETKTIDRLARIEQKADTILERVSDHENRLRQQETLTAKAVGYATAAGGVAAFVFDWIKVHV